MTLHAFAAERWVTGLLMSAGTCYHSIYPAFREVSSKPTGGGFD